jgi:hypothetical protein
MWLQNSDIPGILETMELYSESLSEEERTVYWSKEILTTSLEVTLA